MSASDSRFDVEPSVGNYFAWLRTEIALQRTLLAAVRTAVSLIGFGFTVAQFFQKLELKGAPEHLGPEAPRNLGMMLIATGVVSLALFTAQYHLASTHLRKPPYDVIAGERARSMHMSSYLVSFVVMAMGVAAFASVFMRF